MKRSFIVVLTATLATLVFTVTAADISSQTRGKIDFVAGTGPVEPLDPDYPDNSLVDISDVNITNDSDSLSLNTVPDFVFANADGTAFPAQLTGEKIYMLHSPQRPHVQVSDLRGSGGGWKLSVSASQFFKDGEPALNGAKIRLLGGSAHSSNQALSPPHVNSTVIIECSDQVTAPVTIVDAADDKGSMGAWIMRWYSQDNQGRTASANGVGVELYIPSGTLALPGNYSAVLYWTLSDTV